MSDVHREIQHRIEGNRVGLLGELCCCWYLNAALCSQRNVDCIQLFKKKCFNPITGASQMLVMKAGSNPFLLEKSSPEKMLTLTCLPKKKTTTCIKYSVCIAGSGTQLMITTTVNKPMKSVWSCCLLMLCFFLLLLQFTMSNLSASMLTMNFGMSLCCVILIQMSH